MSNNTTSLEQAIKEFNEKFIDGRKLIIRDENDIEIGEKSLKQFITKVWHDARASAIDEVLEKMPQPCKKPKNKCINAESRLFGRCFDCERASGYNAAIEQMKEEIKNLI